MIIMFILPYFTETIGMICLRALRKSFVYNTKKCDPTKLPFISIIVASYNEERNVDAKLENLFSQQYPENLMEIIVIDSSTDATADKVKIWQQKYPNLRLIVEKKRKGLAHALNIGYSVAKGNVVIKSDCDILHDPQSMKNLIVSFDADKIGAVSGRQLLSSENKIESGYRYLLNWKRKLESHFGSAYIFETFCAFRKNLIGSLNERSVADEAEMALKVRTRGFYTIFNENAVFYEKSPRSKLERLKQKQRRAQGHIKVHLQNSHIILKQKPDIFSWIIFPTTFFTIIVNPWLLLAMLAISVFQLLTSGLSMLAMLIVVLFISTFAMYSIGKPKYVAGLFESQIALIFGWFVLILKGPSYVWSK
jgi:cellulose synthase/poly-beta-1,6-N-acetylglucosamine synthase-like glycosyltransferase